MTDFEFYHFTKSTLEKMADLRGITNVELKKYYSHTDHFCEFYNDLSDIPQVFAQMTFHMQNATMISNIVKFEKNYSLLKSVTFGFNPTDFLGHYSNATTRINDFVNDLRWNPSINIGLKWNSQKSTNKDAIAKRFAQSMFECAEYLSNFNTRQEVLNDLKCHSTSTNSLIHYFKSKINTGFSVALTCDFLKEFDTYFEFLPKPDIHIKNVIEALKKCEYKKDIDLVEEVQRITRNINVQLTAQGDSPITVYQLDRMIWLVCTGNFFIPGHPNGTMKQVYISKL
jgi:hypothetical protein